MTRIVPFALLTTLALSFVARAQEHQDAARLFPHRMRIDVPAGATLCRVDIPEAVIARTRPDLSDLRILDREHDEVAYLLDRAQFVWPAGVAPHHDALPTRMTRRRLEPRRYEEVLTFTLPDAVLPGGARWTLNIQTNVAAFASRFEIGNEDGTLSHAGTLFRMQGPLRERLAIPLPSGQPGATMTLRLVSETYLEPVLALHASVMNDRSTTLRMSLPIVERQRSGESAPSGGQSTFTLERPTGLSPTTLRLSTTTRFFAREVSVFDVREGEEPVRSRRQN